MAAVSSLGIGSGLDLNTLLAGMRSAEQAPLVALQAQQSSYTAKLSAYGQLNSALSALQTAAAALAKPAVFESVTASSTATDVVTATALSTATTGTYALNVTQLSQAQSLATTGKRDTSTNIGDAVATTTATRVTFEFGTTSGASFTLDADATRTKSIDIDPARSSLADIAKKINDTAGLGVTASIVNDGSAAPFRLVLTSTQTGEASSMRMTVSGDADHPAGDPALSGLLTHNPAGPKLEQTVAAQNTKLTVNGIAITSATNSVAGAVQDVTMTVAKLGASTLSVKKDTDSVGNAIATFVNAYNSLQSVATKLTAFNATSKSGAVLLGDSTLRNIQVRIRSALTTAQTPDASGLATLTQVGIAMQKDGTLSFDAAKLRTVLDSQMSGVANLFAGSAGVGGYGTQMSSLLTGFTDTTNGTLTAATKGLNTTLDSLGKQYTATSARIDATIARYKAQFTQLDTLISSMNQTSSYLTQQFDAMNNSNKK
jgi:flagellar hook-associated protein 2